MRKKGSDLDFIRDWQYQYEYCMLNGNRISPATASQEVDINLFIHWFTKGDGVGLYTIVAIPTRILYVEWKQHLLNHIN